MRSLSVETTRLIEQIHPTAFNGDTAALAQATAGIADVLGGLFGVLRQHAPNEATFRAAAKMMIERSLRFAEDAQRDADKLGVHVAPAYQEHRHGEG